MLDPQLKQWMTKGYIKLGDIAYNISLGMLKGKNGTASQRKLYEQGIKMSAILKVLFKHITFDEVTSLPTLWLIDELTVNKLVRCLIELGELEKLPIVPNMFPTVKPIILNSGLPGNPGLNGLNGTNANIIVEPEDDEDQIKVREVIEGTIKRYKLKFDLYTAQLLSSSGGGLFEIGDLRTFNVVVTSTKTRNDIQTLTCTSDSTMNTQLQALINLPTLNGVSQSVSFTLPVVDQGTGRTYSFQSFDGKTTRSASNSISFVYPYLYGSHDLASGFDYYAQFQSAKLIAGKANRSFVFNDTNKYFYILYHESYGTLSSIKDSNGFEKITDFTTGLVNVSSNGLDNNWSNVSYRYYRTTLKTSIPNAPYTITHN